MKIRSLISAANTGFMSLLVFGIKAEAAEVLSAIGIQLVMERLRAEVRARDRTQARLH